MYIIIQIRKILTVLAWLSVVDFVVSVYTCEPDMVELTWVGDSCFYLVWSNSECVIRSEVTLYADRTQKNHNKIRVLVTHLL